MHSVKNRLKNWKARKTTSQKDDSSVVGVASPTPPSTDPSGKKAEVALAMPVNGQPIPTPAAEATLKVPSDTPVHTHVSHSASLVVPAEADPGPEEHLTKQSTELSISQRVWNAAYDSLEEDKDTADLVKSYLKTLTAVLKADKDSGISSPEDDDDLAAEVKSPIRRQEYLKKLVDKGQQKIETSSKIKMAVGDVAQFILSAKGMIDLAIQNIPQAALPWAGVCIGLQILLNPAQATKSNLAGIAYVTSRMDWYCALTEHLLNKNNIMTGTESFQEVLERLDKAVVALYKELLLYQMKSVCSYYRHRGIGFLRGLANLDDWDGDLAHVKNAEDVVRDYSERHYREYQKRSLRQLVNSGGEMEKLLGDIRQDLGDFIELQKKTRTQDEDKECLQDLFAVDPQYDMMDLEEKKDTLLEDAYAWVLSTPEYAAFTNWFDDGGNRTPCRVLWINGPAGTGKTMLFIGVIRELSGQPSTLSPSLSYFFCQGTDQTRNSATIILRSLIWQLLVQQPRLISHLRDQRRNAGAPLLRGERAFYVLSDAFRSMLKDPGLSPVYFAIDALDECDRKTPGLEQLFQVIDTSLALSSKVKWLLSSRPEILDHAGVKKLKDLHASRVRVNLDFGRLEAPVNAYIDHKLESMHGKEGYDTDTLATLSHEIRQRAMSTFLWVALAFKELDEVNGWDAVEAIQRIPSGLSNVYDLIMAQIEEGTPEDQKRCKNILVAVVLAYRRLSLPELVVLAGLQPKIKPQAIIKKCGSFLTMSGETVSLIHQSAKEYLEANYTTRLGSGVGQGHADISARSIDAMGSILKQNIYALPHPGFESGDVTPPDPDPLAPVRYSCVFWIGHLRKAKDQSIQNEMTDGRAILQFLNEHVLHWLEALSLIGGISESIRQLKGLQTAIDSANNTELSAFLRDMNRFILFSRQMIDLAPLQVYFSGLVFAPQRSLIRQTFEKSIRDWMFLLPVPELDWSPCLYTLESHSRARSVAFSATGEQLALGMQNGIIKIWDPATGDCTQMLRGHRGSVESITFLGKGNQLASGSGDTTIKVWDTATGDCLQTFREHFGTVTSLSYSATNGRLASASLDGRIKIWDMTTSRCVHTRSEVGSRVYSVALSNNGKKIAAGVGSGGVRLWDTVTGETMHEVASYSQVCSVAFSPDDKLLASGHSDEYDTIKIWDTATGKCMQTLKSHSALVLSVSFSPTGDQLASGSRDMTIRVWDVATGKCIQTLDSRGDEITSVSFSVTGDQLASAGTYVKVWDMAISNHTTALQSHNDHVYSVAFSTSGHRLASCSSDGIVKIWDTATGNSIRTLEGDGDNSRVWLVAFSMTGNRVASRSSDDGMTIEIWDTVTGESMHAFKGQSYAISAAFSPTGEQLAVDSRDGSIKVWHTVTGKCMQLFKGHDNSWGAGVTSVAFSASSEQLASGSDGGNIEVWRMASGDCIRRIQGHHNGRVTSVALSESGHLLASASYDALKTWNMTAGDCIQTLNIRMSIHHLKFDPTSTYLLTEIGRIKVDLPLLAPATTSATGVTEEQSELGQESREVQDGENSEINDYQLEEKAEGEFEEGPPAEKQSAEEESLTSNHAELEDELFEEEESADEVSGEEDIVAIAPGTDTALYYPEIKVYGYGLSLDKTWITRDGRNFLWLPPEFRPGSWAVQGQMVAIGCPSGRVLMFGFPPEGPSGGD